MYETIEDYHTVKIRKNRHCNDCERIYYKWQIMFTSVWKFDGDVSRVYECTDCIDWIGKNPKEWNEVCESENVYQWWIRDVEPLPNFLQK